jgi:hypothetical protein
MIIHQFTDVPRRARLKIDITQEGQGHTVSGRLSRNGDDCENWPNGELEDSVTNVTLAESGSYLLFLVVLFFGPVEERVAITVAIEDSSASSQSYRATLVGRQGVSHVVTVAISVL